MEQLQKILLTEDSLTSQEMLARQVGKYLRTTKTLRLPNVSSYAVSIRSYTSLHASMHKYFKYFKIQHHVEAASIESF